jgi:hypothetical protein
MTTPQVLPKPHPVDRWATVLLAAFSIVAGFVVGVLFLAFTPMQSWWPAWVVVCVGIMVAPLLTGITAVFRVRRARLGFWLPLVGIAVSFALIVVLFVLETSIQPVLQPR